MQTVKTLWNLNKNYYFAKQDSAKTYSSKQEIKSHLNFKTAKTYSKKLWIFHT